jgi:phosphate transport system substrate-binding protein
MKRLIAVAALAALTVPGCAEARTRLSGAGASFPSKIYQRWFADFAKEGGHRVNYQAVGSGSGRKAFLDETVDFGASDDPMKQGDIEKAKRGLVQIPMTGGTIAFGYNMPGCDLKLTQEQAVQVAIGEINNWSQVGCDDQKMTWVYRSDGSGTTAAFTNSMKAFSKKWKLGVGKSVAWPVGIGNKGNAGVAGNIRTTLGAIGYVNQSYIKGEIKAAALQNKNGEYVTPTVESGSLALNGITLDENLAGTDPNPAAEGAYPIATLTWVLAYETGNGRKTEAIKTTLSTLLSENYQEKASVLGYVPLRGDILEKSRAAVERIGK